MISINPSFRSNWTDLSDLNNGVCNCEADFEFYYIFGNICLYSGVGIVGRPPPPVCGSVIVNVGDAEKPNFVQKSDVLTGALLEEGGQGPEVVEVEGFAKIEVGWGGSVFRSRWVRVTEVVRS